MPKVCHALAIVAVSAALGVALNSCSAVEYHAAVASLQPECQRDAEARWLRPKPSISNWLFISQTDDPHSGAAIKPTGVLNDMSDLQFVKALFSATGLNSMSFYVSQVGAYERQTFGPDARPGVYAIRVARSNSFTRSLKSICV